MKLRHHIAILITAAVPLALSCGASSGSHPSGHVSTPTAHRTAPPPACPGVAPMPMCPFGGECATDADCTAGSNGRCITTSMCTCRYNDCVTDADCGAGRDCACETRGGAGSSGNQPTTCVPSNCRSDDDCGPGGFCSPSQTPQASCGSLLGWFCHTAHDECGIDSDCVSDGAGGAATLPACIFSPERGVWICSTGFFCAG